MMFSYARVTAMLLLVGLVFMTGARAQDTVPVRFSGPVERVPYKIYVDDVFVGVMGDAVNMPLGMHRVAVKGPHGAWLDMNLNFGIGLIGNDGVTVRQPECHDKPEFVESWPWHYEPRATKTIVHIGQPVIGMRAPKPCPRPRLPVFRSLGRVTISLASTPNKAVILVDGARRGTTPRKLAVPYNKATEAINVVIRQDGYVNCRTELRPPFPDEQIIDCQLEPF